MPSSLPRGVLAAYAALGVAAWIGGPAYAQAPAPVQSALAPDNLAKPRPAPPFDLTGMWQHELTDPDSWRFVPKEFELTPEAQAHYEAGLRAQAEGKLYRDDIGQCWPAGMPLIMTRVWPIAMIQLPTAIYMISHFMNSVRVIYLDGRPHSDPNVVVPSWNGESIGWWEGDTLVVDTRYFPGHHHWMDQGGASIPASDQLHIVERIRMIENGEVLEIEYTMTDPKMWKGEWKTTKRFVRKNDVDITEVECLPDLNENLPATSSQSLVR
ncbi:MAG TPA: hypothetical protein VIN61_18725 [Gammaproteobacteria bacterium]